MIELLIIFSAGTFAGSFFYTLAIRYSSGMMAGTPVKALFSRSKCPHCGVDVSIAGLIPVAGYFIIRGKCAKCGERVSLLYPLWEIAFGMLAIAVALFHGRGILSVNIYLICALCLSIAIIDVKSMVIPPSLVIIFILLSIYPVLLHHDIMDNVYGFAVLTVFFLLMLLIFPGAFGGGDIKLYAAAGFLLGLEMSIVLLDVSLISGAVFGVAFALIKGRNFRIKIPFAPFIAAGIIITLLFGDTILLVYYRNII
jgi:leader peptidase (prepilin peptidase)/N-methyltransferase